MKSRKDIPNPSFGNDNDVTAATQHSRGTTGLP